VEAALTDLGCTIERGMPGRTDRVVRWKAHTAVLEIKGLSKSAGERDAAQLEKWVSEHTVEHGQVPKGILLANTWRATPLDARRQAAFPDQMVPYASGRNHCLATTSQLLSAVVVASSVRKKDAFLKALFSTVGILEGWNWQDALDIVPEPEDTNATSAE
jgi:hypothetical protein